MAAPTLETNAGATALRITDGTSGNPVIWDDVWAFGAGGGAGLVPIDGGGTARVDTFMTEIVADAMYVILKNINFGDGATSTYFQSTNEMVYFEDGVFPTVLANASVIIGEPSNITFSQNGSKWSFEGPTLFPNAGNLEVYGSIIEIRGGGIWSICGNGAGGDVKFYQSILDMNGQIIIVRAGINSLTIDGLYISNIGVLTIRTSADINNLALEAPISGAAVNSAGDATIDALNVTNFITNDVGAGQGDITFKNPLFHISAPSIQDAGDSVIEQYTCNIHVTDKDGADLEGVTVLCEDEAEAEVFSVETDSDGDIAEQTIDYKKWEGTDETLTTLSPHKFTFTHDDYPDLVMSGITVDHPLIWEIDMGQSSADLLAIVEAGVSTLATATALSTHDGKLDTVDSIVDAIVEDTGTTLPALLAALGVGDGSVVVDHNTGGADELAYKTGGGIGIDNAVIRAYLKSDYDAGNTGAAYIKAATMTDVNGRWVSEMNLDPATYTLYYFKQEAYGPDTKEVEVT